MTASFAYWYLGMRSDPLYTEAMGWFEAWMDAAKAAGIGEPTAMTLATATRVGQPSLRAVLLKAYDWRGFVFYTNLHSVKASQLQANPAAALCFFWPSLGRQIRVEGRVALVAPEEADAYFATRSRDSQIGAWASDQSQVLSTREALETRFSDYQHQYRDRAVPRPPHWSGYRLAPSMIEFWQSGMHRLHERHRFRLGSRGWTKHLLNP